jgi:5-methylcytosine-specific restriction endonuclease McrA
MGSVRVTAARSTTTRDRDRKAIARTKPPCGICEQPIDYTLKFPDPMSFEVDHIVALHNGGADTLDNKQASHRKCNRDKWHTLAEAAGPRTFVTARTW